MKFSHYLFYVTALPLALMAGSAGAAPRGSGSRGAHGLFYSDPSARSSAEVDQVLPNSHEVVSTFTAVNRILFRRGIFVIHWGHGAVTVLPSRFVLNITVNKHRVIPPAVRPKPQ
jgi:hypothetical protein